MSVNHQPKRAAARRNLAWAAAAVLGLVGLAGGLWSVFGLAKVVLTEKELQERTNRQLPREVRGVTIERVTVALAENQIALRMEIHGSALAQPYAAVAFARGVPRYDAERGELFFDAEAVKIESLTVRNTTLIGRQDSSDPPRGGAIGQAIRERFPRLEAAAQSVIESGAKSYLATRPVYRIKDDMKGIAIKAAVGDITIAQDALVVSLSAWRFTVTLAGWLLLLLIAVVVVIYLVRHPLWGLATMADSVNLE